MNKSSEMSQKDYIPHHAMEPGPLSDRKLTGTWRDYITVMKLGIIGGNLITLFVGMWIASYGLATIQGSHILLTILGTTLIIASGTCLNNYFDRDMDQKMKRTQKRVLAVKRLDPRQVLIMGIIFAILGSICLVSLEKPTALFVALFGLFGYVVLYTLWTKRRHHLNTIVGSIAGAVPPVIGWTAVTGTIDAGAWILFAIMFIWQVPHFLAIAIRRHDDYKNAGVPMLPVVKGFTETKWFMLNYTAALVPVSLVLPLFAPIHVGYIGLALALGIGWLYVAIKGFKTEDTMVWARKNFVFSLIYLVVLFFGMIPFQIIA